MRTIKYIRANSLMTESEHAHQESTYYEYSNKMASYNLLVIGDFSLMNLDMNKCRDLLEIIEVRDCHKSTIIRKGQILRPRQIQRRSFAALAIALSWKFS